MTAFESEIENSKYKLLGFENNKNLAVIMIIATGAQGEEFAALMRMSNKTHKFVRLQQSDTVILSSSVIGMKEYIPGVSNIP